MNMNISLKTRMLLLVSAMLVITLASSRLRADTAVCGGQSITLPFTDVMGNSFFCQIAAAYFSGLTNGTTATTYSPTQTVTREQMAAFITRTMDQSLKRGSRRAALDQWWVPAFNNLYSETPVDNEPGGVKSDGADLWVANYLSGTISRVRASDGQLLGTWTGATRAAQVLVARGRIFVTGNMSPGVLYMIDPTQPPGPVTVLSSSLGAFPQGIAFDGSRIWTANVGSNSVSIYGLDGSLTTVPGFSFSFGIVYDGTHMWVTNQGNGRLTKLDSNGNIIQSIVVGSNPAFPVFDGTNIWVPNLDSNSVTVVRVKDATGNPLPPPPASNQPFVLTTLTDNGLNGPRTAAFDGERILVTNSVGSSVSLWKAADLSPLGSFDTPVANDTPYGACSDGLNFWVTLNAVNRLKRF
jgi:hypothetical protein